MRVVGGGDGAASPSHGLCNDIGTAILLMIGGLYRWTLKLAKQKLLKMALFTPGKAIQCIVIELADFSPDDICI